MHYIPGLSLRVEHKQEQVGIDYAEMGENFDVITRTGVNHLPTLNHEPDQFRVDPYLPMEAMSREGNINGFPPSREGRTIE
jgi:hypothetical protein